ncbi:MAG: hypothetical protein QOH68_1502 [Nocardioidaceae bacterium]|nr:hypothetical protein [Nocardioidaceae bacterium]
MVAGRAQGDKVAVVNNDAVVKELVSDYLDRLSAASSSLPPARREELVAEVREHIDVATRAERAAGNAGEAGVRNVLDRLGSPEDIAREAIEQEPGVQPPAQPPPPQNTNVRDIATVLLLMFGGFLIGIGWVVGVALLWSSTRWRTRDKWLATLVWPFGYLGVLFLAGSAGLSESSTTFCSSVATVPAGATAHETCTTTGFSLPPWAGILFLVILLIAPVLVAVRLLRQPSTPRVDVAQR